MPTTTKTVREDKREEHVIVFPCDRKQLIPPANYQEKMAWIRSSCESLLNQIKETNSLREFCNKP